MTPSSGLSSTWDKKTNTLNSITFSKRECFDNEKKKRMNAMFSIDCLNPNTLTLIECDAHPIAIKSATIWPRVFTRSMPACTFFRSCVCASCRFLRRHPFTAQPVRVTLRQSVGFRTIVRRSVPVEKL